MTEAEWLACADPLEMLGFLRGKVSDRKLRLFACACCRRVLAFGPCLDNDLYEALTIAENLADGLVGQEEALRIRSRLESISPYSEKWSASGAARAALDAQVYLAAEGAARHSVNHFGNAKEEHRTFLARLLGMRRAAPRNSFFQPTSMIRDIFGNPFRPMSLYPAWLTPETRLLAEAIYEERTFEQMPIVGDALESVGCNSADILSHCRQPGVHWRGCFVIDLLLGKE
jgi:hypothetical protein